MKIERMTIPAPGIVGATHHRWVAILFGLVLLSSADLLWAQSDRGTITGTVTDPSGAVIVGATVTATNTATGVSTKVTTGSNGTFTIPLLQAGSYEVSAEQSGFKKSTETGLVLQIGDSIRADISMQLGSTAETVNVTGQSDAIQRDTSGRGNLIKSRDIEVLPIVSQREQRNPGFLLTLAPGVTGRGTVASTASGSSRQLNTTVNGSQSGSTEFHLDGAVIGQAGSLAGNFGLLFFPPEVVGEYKAMTLNPPAEYGQSGMGIATFSLRSGNNHFHASAWEYLRNEKLDARGFVPTGASRETPLNRQNEFGVTAGGRIVKDKLFFYAWYGGFRLSKEVGANSAETLPTAAMKAGNLSPYLIDPTPLGTDALGRPILTGAIYDPRCTRTVTAGQPDPGIPGNPLCPSTGLTATETTLIRDPFPGNIIPADRIDPVAKAMFDQFVDPPACSACRAGFVNNWTAVSKYAEPHNQYGGKIDYNLSDSHRFMGEFIWWRNRPVVGSRFPGAISDGSIQTHDQNIARFSHDWIIGPNIVNHWVLGFNRDFTDNFPDGGIDWPSKLGYAGVPQTGPGSTFPPLSIGGLSSYGPGGQGYSASNTFTFNDSLTYAKGRHTIKTGISYYQFHVNAFSVGDQSSRLTLNSGQSSLPGLFYSDSNALEAPFTGMGVASFLLGQVGLGGAQLVIAPVEDREGRYAGFVQDDFKVNSKLTLNLGLRYDLMRPVVNKKDQVSWFDPQVVNPDIGIRGALIFATPSRRNGAVTDFTNFGPRFGLAYSLSSKTVIRAGYGILYTAGQSQRSMGNSFNQVGFSAFNSVQTDQTFPGLPGFLPAFLLRDGWPANRFQPPPFKGPSSQNGFGPMSFGAFPGGGLNPDIQNWTFGIQRQFKGNVLFDVAYVGTKGTHLSSRLMSTNVMPTHFLTDRSLQYPIFDSSGVQFDVGHYIQSSIADPTVQALPVVQAMPISMGFDSNGNPANVHVPFPGFQALWINTVGAATLGQALRPFPQYGVDSLQPGGEAGGQMENNSEQVGVSTYHALQVQARRRFARGLNVLVSYTWSKTLTDAESQFSEFSGFTEDYYNRRGEKALSLNDYAHNLVFSYEYELPFGPGRKYVNSGGVSGKVLGGWIVAGVHQYQSGPPTQIVVGTSAFWPYAGAKGFLSRANVVPGVEKRSAAFLNGTWDPNRIDDTGSVFNFDAWTNPGADFKTKWNFGNAPRTDGAIHQFPYYNEDIAIIKRTNVTESVIVEFRADFLNLFNRTLYGFDQGGDQYGQIIGGGGNMGFGRGSFGHITSQGNFPREIQFGLRINY